MESQNELQTFKEKPDPSKDILMEDFCSIDPGDISKIGTQEKSNTFTRYSFFRNTFSRDTFTLSNLKDVKERMKERAKNVKASRVVTGIAIFLVIGIFSIPVIMYYTLKTEPLPELENTLKDVNISMVNLYVYIATML